MNNRITMTIGVDVGDTRSQYYGVDEETGEVRRGSIVTSREGVRRVLASLAPSPRRVRVVLEVGTHSPWLSELIEKMGHEAVVANARRLRFIFGSKSKSDRTDAEMLARVGRMDVALVHPIRHRSTEDQEQIARLRARDGLVQARTKLVLTARGLAKPFGVRLPQASTPAFPKRVREANLPPHLADTLNPLLAAIAELTTQIAHYDKMLEAACAHPSNAQAVNRMKQVTGVGNLTALAMRLVLQDPARFRRSRDVGPYLGLTPGRDQSGARDIKLGITKQGDAFMRRLLVQSAHYILGPHGPACDLRTFGERLQGGGMSRKRAATAVARKLAVLLHALWKNDADYRPDHLARSRAAAAPAA